MITTGTANNSTSKTAAAAMTVMNSFITTSYHVQYTSFILHTLCANAYCVCGYVITKFRKPNGLKIKTNLRRMWKLEQLQESRSYHNLFFSRSVCGVQ